MASAKIVEKYGPEVPMSPTSFVMFNGDTRLATRIHREEPDLAVRQPAVFAGYGASGGSPRQLEVPRP
jgi:hypothetical protein